MVRSQPYSYTAAPSSLFLPTASFDRHIGARSIDMWTRWCHTVQPLGPFVPSVCETHANKARDANTAVCPTRSHTPSFHIIFFYILNLLYTHLKLQLVAHSAKKMLKLKGIVVMSSQEKYEMINENKGAREWRKAIPILISILLLFHTAAGVKGDFHMF